MRFKFLIEITLFLSLGQPNAFAGGMTSSGGELPTDEGNPWFIGEKPVSYCIVNGFGSGQFSVSDDLVTKWISDVLSDWSETIRQFSPAPVNLGDGKLRNLTTDFKRVNVQQSVSPENSDCELSFVLGLPTAHPAIESAISQRWVAKELIAFAKRTNFDLGSGRGRGFVYFSPDLGSPEFLERYGYHGKKHQADYWNSELVFKQILAHELGHVFGLGHEAQFIMKQSLPWKVVAKSIKRYIRPQGFFAMTGYHRKQQTCGRSTSQSEVLNETFGVGQIGQVCWTQKEGNGLELGGGLQVQLSGSAGSKEYFLPASGWTQSLMPIRGGYVAANRQTGGELEILRHIFLQFPVKASYRATFEFHGNLIPVLFESDSLGNFDLTVFRDGVYYDLGIFFPDFEG
jgi:hypothetical protein